MSVGAGRRGGGRLVAGRLRVDVLVVAPGPRAPDAHRGEDGKGVRSLRDLGGVEEVEGDDATEGERHEAALVPRGTELAEGRIEEPPEAESARGVHLTTEVQAPAVVARGDGTVVDHGVREELDPTVPDAEQELDIAVGLPADEHVPVPGQGHQVPGVEDTRATGEPDEHVARGTPEDGQATSRVETAVTGGQREAEITLRADPGHHAVEPVLYDAYEAVVGHPRVVDAAKRGVGGARGALDDGLLAVRQSQGRISRLLSVVDATVVLLQRGVLLGVGRHGSPRLGERIVGRPVGAHRDGAHLPDLGAQGRDVAAQAADVGLHDEQRGLLALTAGAARSGGTRPRLACREARGARAGAELRFAELTGERRDGLGRRRVGEAGGLHAAGAAVGNRRVAASIRAGVALAKPCQGDGQHHCCREEEGDARSVHRGTPISGVRWALPTVVMPVHNGGPCPRIFCRRAVTGAVPYGLS